MRKGTLLGQKEERQKIEATGYLFSNNFVYFDMFLQTLEKTKKKKKNKKPETKTRKSNSVLVHGSKF